MFDSKDLIYKIKVIIVYVLLIAGGLWNFLGYFQTIMNSTAGIVIIIISLFLLFEILDKKVSKIDSAMGNSLEKYKKNMLLFFIFIVVSSWLIEYLGVKTGYIFGNYSYGKILIPQIDGVPLAIGFAWFSSLIVSLGLIQTYTKVNLRLFSPIKKSLLTGFIMTIFDYALEGAAVNLGYWKWQIGIVPFQNYLAWFIFGSLFTFLGFKFQVLEHRLPKIATHLFFAQMIFFIISSF